MAKVNGKNCQFLKVWRTSAVWGPSAAAPGVGTQLPRIRYRGRHFHLVRSPLSRSQGHNELAGQVTSQRMKGEGEKSSATKKMERPMSGEPIQKLEEEIPHGESLSRSSAKDANEDLEQRVTPVSATSTAPESTVNFGFLPVPTNCRVSPTKPYKLNLAINILFAFASTFTVFSEPPVLTLGGQFILQSTDFNPSVGYIWRYI
jgi:hypothetical protein